MDNRIIDSKGKRQGCVSTSTEQKFKMLGEYGGNELQSQFKLMHLN